MQCPYFNCPGTCKYSQLKANLYPQMNDDDIVTVFDPISH